MSAVSITAIVTGLFFLGMGIVLTLVAYNKVQGNVALWMSIGILLAGIALAGVTFVSARNAAPGTKQKGLYTLGAFALAMTVVGIIGILEHENVIKAKVSKGLGPVVIAFGVAIVIGAAYVAYKAKSGDKSFDFGDLSSSSSSIQLT